MKAKKINKNILITGADLDCQGVIKIVRKYSSNHSTSVLITLIKLLVFIGVINHIIYQIF